MAQVQTKSQSNIVKTNKIDNFDKSVLNMLKTDIESIPILKEVFEEAFRNSNKTYDVSQIKTFNMYIDILLKFHLDNDIRHRLEVSRKTTDKITFEKYVDLLLTVNHKNTVGNYSEYVRFQRILLNKPFSYDKLAGYVNDTKIYDNKYLCESLNPRAESLVVEWILNMCHYDKYISPHMKDVIVTFQAILDDNGKKMDIGFLIQKNDNKYTKKEFEKYDHRIFIEIQENSYNHKDTKNDKLKNTIACNNNCLIYYFSMEDYKNNEATYLYNFWNSIFKNKLLGAILQNPKNGDRWFQVAHFERLEQERDNAIAKQNMHPKGSDEYNKYKSSIIKSLIQLDNDSKDKLIELFNFKHHSITQKELGLNDQVIDLDKVFEYLQLNGIKKSDLLNKLLSDSYAKFTIIENKYYINWSFLLHIVNNYAKPDIRLDLESYFISLEELYPIYGNKIKEYLNKHINFLRTRNTIDKDELEFKYKREIEFLKEDKQFLKNKNDKLNNLIVTASKASKDYIKSRESYIDFWERYRASIKLITHKQLPYYASVNNPAKKILKDDKDIKDKLDEILSVIDTKINDNIIVTPSNIVLASDHDLNFQIDDISVINNFPEFPIIYSSDELQFITYDGLMNIGTEYNIQETVINKIIKLSVDGKNKVDKIGRPTHLRHLKIRDTYPDYQKYNVVGKSFIVKPIDNKMLMKEYIIENVSDNQVDISLSQKAEPSEDLFDMNF